MTVCIILTKFSIFAILIVSLLLCISIPSIISDDQINEESVINQTDETNQTITVDELSENVQSDLNSELPTSTILSIVEEDVSTILTENKSEIIDEIPLTTVSSLIVDNQTTDDQQQTTPSSIKKNLSNINSFEEWKQQQLLADLSKKGDTTNRNNVPSETPAASVIKGTVLPANIQQATSTNGLPKKGKLRKNFASASCGAKILANNIEAQNVASILSSSPDEYMLNPCNAKIWFVIELCESIRILNLEIANFELFSSVPKTFRVSASDRYPTKDWHRYHLGTFNASSNRTIQSFQTMELTTYLKYIKIELLDFHGHEHYCPLSVVRIHGSNVEDEIMTMEENTNLNELKSSSDIQGENDNDDDDDDDDEDLTNDQQVGGIIGSAILDLAKRVFRRQTIRGTPSTTSIPIIETNVLKTDCHQTVLNGSIINDSIQAWRRSDTFKQCIADFIDGLWSKFDTCTSYLSQICFKLNYCCQCPLIPLDKNQSQVTLNLYANPCGYYHILTNQFICQKEKFLQSNKTILNDVNRNLSQALNDKNLTIEKNDTVIITNESTNISSNQSILNLNNTLLTETHIQSITNRSNDSNNTFNETTVILESQIPVNTTDETSSQSSIPEPMSIELNMTESTIEIINTEDISTTTTPSTLNNNEVIPPIISSPWLKGMLVNTKSLPELFKIIEKLNFNLTLSNRYLQELSQHYVKKLDETQQTTDLLLKSSTAANEKLENLEEHLIKLQENFNEMSYRLMKLEAWIPLIICIILCLFIWCIWSTCYIIRLRRKYKYLTKEFQEIKNTKQVEPDDDDPPIIYNGIKKRKLSTDSSDSNPTRSQRVPDLTLPKITENGIGKHKHKHKLKGKSSNQIEHLLLSTTHT